VPAILTAAVPLLSVPDPLGFRFKSTLVSSPVEDKMGPAPAAALAIVNSFTAVPVAVKRANSSPLVSKIDVPIFGEVKVLFVKVVVEVAVTKADVASTIFGLVASSAAA